MEIDSSSKIAAALVIFWIGIGEWGRAGETWDNTNGKAAASVLGQADLDNGQEDRGGAAAANTMHGPEGVAVDPATGKVFVADRENNRVLRFASAAALTDGSAAEAVFGQPDFETTANDLSRSRMTSPSDVVVDAAGRLWVAERVNSRVLRFDNAAAKLNGADADGVLGQPNFTTNSFATTASKMWAAVDVIADAKGSLWVAGSSNSRVLRFDQAALKGDGASADGVLGQAIFTSGSPATNSTGLFEPYGLALDGSGRLWVADLENHRVVRFQANRFQPDGRIGKRVASQTGNGVYNGDGAGQIAKVKVRGNRSGKAFFSVENDGDQADNYTVSGTRGNKKLKVKYFRTPGGNVTAAMTRGGVVLNAFPAGGNAAFKAKIKGTPKSKGKKAGKTLTVQSTSQTDGETDVVKAKVKKTP